MKVAFLTTHDPSKFWVMLGKVWLAIYAHVVKRRGVWLGQMRWNHALGELVGSG